MMRGLGRPAVWSVVLFSRRDTWESSLLLTWNLRGFLFGSEIKALMRDSVAPRDRSGRVHYMLAYLWTPAPRTWHRAAPARSCATGAAGRGRPQVGAHVVERGRIDLRERAESRSGLDLGAEEKSSRGLHVVGGLTPGDREREKENHASTPAGHRGPRIWIAKAKIPFR